MFAIAYFAGLGRWLVGHVHYASAEACMAAIFRHLITELRHGLTPILCRPQAL